MRAPERVTRYPLERLRVHTHAVYEVQAKTRTLWPIAPGRTRIVTDWLFEPETMARADFDASDVLSFTQLIAEQDWLERLGARPGQA